MKRILLIATLLAASAPVLATDLGMSINVGQPGFYGRIDIGDYPQPRVVYRQPIMVEPMEIERPPIYMRVPPGHARNWKKHCRKYGACDERVLFVQDKWYRNEYVPHYQKSHGGHRDEYRGRKHPGNRHGQGHQQ